MDSVLYEEGQRILSDRIAEQKELDIFKPLPQKAKRDLTADPHSGSLLTLTPTMAMPACGPCISLPCFMHVPVIPDVAYEQSLA